MIDSWLLPGGVRKGLTGEETWCLHLADERPLPGREGEDRCHWGSHQWYRTVTTVAQAVSDLKADRWLHHPDASSSPARRHFSPYTGRFLFLFKYFKNFILFIYLIFG